MLRVLGTLQIKILLASNERRSTYGALSYTIRPLPVSVFCYPHRCSRLYPLTLGRDHGKALRLCMLADIQSVFNSIQTHASVQLAGKNSACFECGWVIRGNIFMYCPYGICGLHLFLSHEEIKSSVAIPVTLVLQRMHAM
jgi:hypothetical protein